jgi:hypothetical protein
MPTAKRVTNSTQKTKKRSATPSLGNSSYNKGKSLRTQKGGDGWSVKSKAKCQKIFAKKAGCKKECIKAGKNGDKIIKAPGFGGCEVWTVKNQKEKSKRIAEFNRLNEQDKKKNN